MGCGRPSEPEKDPGVRTSGARPELVCAAAQSARGKTIRLGRLSDEEDLNGSLAPRAGGIRPCMERHVPCWNVFRVEGKEPGTQERRAVSICASGTDRLPAWWQPAANLLQLPILFAVLLLAMVIRELFVHPPSTIILGVCAGLAALDIVLAVYLLRDMGSTLVVTADDITFTRRRRRGKGPPPQQVIRRAAGSMLSFRMAANGPVGSEYTGYALKLRDNATGKEVYAGAFGRRKVQQACESQGWSFS